MQLSKVACITTITAHFQHSSTCFADIGRSLQNVAYLFGATTDIKIVMLPIESPPGFLYAGRSLHVAYLYGAHKDSESVMLVREMCIINSAKI